jgi:hypothetical protein
MTDGSRYNWNIYGHFTYLFVSMREFAKVK